MTWDIALVLLLLLVVFVSFVWEKLPPDLTAMALFVALIGFGLLAPADAFSVFSNTAPLTVGAMFILSAALVKCGIIDRLSGLVEASGSWPYVIVMAVLVFFVAGISGPGRRPTARSGTTPRSPPPEGLRSRPVADGVGWVEAGC